MVKLRQTEAGDEPAGRKGWTPPRGITLVSFPQRPARPYGVQWRVDGKRKTKTFPTIEKQLDFAKGLADDAKRHGTAAYRLDESEARDWRAFRAMVGEGADLQAIAAVWSKHKAASTATPLTLAEAIAAYTAAKEAEGVARSSVSHYKPVFDRLTDTVPGHREVSGISDDDIAAFMTAQADAPDHTRSTRFRRIRALFNWLVETHKIERSPFAGIKAPKVRSEDVEILTLAQSRLLFGKNAANDDGSPISQERRETIGRLALEAFAGLRFDTAAQIVADEIQADGLRIPAAKIKTRKNQFIDGLPANLMRWLAWSKPAEWSMTKRQYLEAKSDAFTRAGIPHPRNCLRHGFATYHVAAFKGAGRTATILCHTSEKILWAHYKGRATEADGKAYFKIFPPAKSQD